MSLKDRVRRLEGDAPNRCNNCREWGDFVRYEHDPAECDPGCHEPAYTHGGGMPERCECGYEPLTVLITHTWAAGRL